MKKFLSTFLATSMVMAACVATASTASASVSSVTLPTAYGGFHTWEAEDYVSEFIQQGGSTPEEGIETATVTGASGGKCIHDGTVSPTSADNPVQLVLPVYVEQETVYEMEVVTGPNTIVHNKNYFKLDDTKIFQTKGGSTSVTCESLDWKAKDSTHYVATKYTTQITIPAGEHTITFAIPPRGSETYGGMMLDYIKLTSCAEEKEQGISFAETGITDATESVTANAYYEGSSNDRVTLYVALYDVNGKLLKVESAYSTEDSAELSKNVTLVENTHFAKAFLWGDNLVPMFGAASVSKPAQQ